MFKIITLLLSILSKNIIGNENNYRIVEKEYVENNIVQTIDDEYFLVYDDKYSLFYNNYNFDLSNYDDVCVYKRNGKIYIIASNKGNLENIILSKTLEKEQQITLVRDGITNWQSEMYNNKIYIYGKSNEYNDLTYEEKNLDCDDAFLLIIDEFNNIDYNFYGGKTNEEFQKILINNNYIIAAGYKSPLGEGDFGNGGKYEKTVFITKIENKSIKNYIILNEYDNIVDLFYYDNTYYLVLQNGIYFLDENLSLIEQITYSNIIDASQISETGLMAIFSSNRLDIYDLNNKRHEEILYPYKEIKKIKNSFIVVKEEKKVLCDLIDLTNFYSRYEYMSEKTDLYSLFGKCSYQNVTFWPNIDYQVYGEYQCYLSYQTLGGIYFEYETIYNIEREANVCNGGIYPVGYRLIFTGRGYLDGNLILNNYQIVNSGLHVLELVGANDEVYSISFEVSNYQIPFEDILNRSSELEIRCGEKFTIDLKLNNEKEIEIESLLINDSEYYDFLYDSSNHLLTISFSPKQEVGKYIYNIEKLYYKLNGKTYCEFLNYRFVVNALKDNLDTQIISFEGLSLYVDCFDYHKSARYFKAIAFNDFEEKEYSFPISNGDIYLTDLKINNSYNVRIYLVSDINSRDLLLNPIVDIHIIPKEKNVYLGKVLVLKYQEFLERFAISFNKAFSKGALKEISINDKLIFKNNRQNLGKYILMCCGAFVFGVGVIVVSKLLIKKKKNGK